ncbi:MAG: hypothetical protein DHS20C18_53800 [Saprospiraceae bacterium]|nr:MAG: hypothetical protein DHS20C18_53800 [Saprospiraceae bacterium]
MAIGIIVMVALALAFILFFNLLQRKLLKEKNQRQELQLRHQETLLHSTILTQEKERSRIARDLHDEIGSKLNVIHLNMHRLKKIESQSTELAETVEEVNQLIHNTIDTTRRISHELLPPTLEEFGLIEALKELTDGYESSGQIEIILQHQSADWKRNKVIEINLFRIVQELLSNTVKHSDTESVLIDVNLSNQQFRLYYEDNGKGFLLDEAQRNGLGLRNLESRASMIKAKLDFQTAPEQGVKVTVANLS